MNYISESNFINLCDYFFPPYDNFLGGTKCEKLLDVHNLKENVIIYLSLNGLKQFVEYVFPHIKVPFTLISGLSDFIVPYFQEPNRYYAVDNMLNSDKLIKWYAINVLVKHPKICLIPLGIPRALPWVEKYKIDGIYDAEYMGWYSNDFNKHVVMETIYRFNNKRNILDIIKDKKDSPNLIYINYTSENSDNSNIEMNKNFRRKLDDYILNNTPFKKQENLLPWIDNLKKTQEYKFVLESFGRCLDGYRVWEALLVGTIPIVFDSSIREIYDDLPILVIDGFDKLNEEYLNAKYEEIISRTDYKFEKLYMDYWSDIILKK